MVLREPIPASDPPWPRSLLGPQTIISSTGQPRLMCALGPRGARQPGANGALSLKPLLQGPLTGASLTPTLGSCDSTFLWVK